MAEPTPPAIAELYERLPELRACAKDLDAAFVMLRDCFAQGGQVLLCGNGGSASDAEHIAGELLKGFEHPRKLGKVAPELAAKLPADLAERLQAGLPAIPLTGFTALRSAVGNDLGPDVDYAQLVLALGRPGDVLVGISTSGNAANVNHAVAVARAKGMKVLAMTAAGGGRLAESADVCLRAPQSQTRLAQEQHLAMYHALCLALERAAFGEAG